MVAARGKTTAKSNTTSFAPARHDEPDAALSLAVAETPTVGALTAAVQAAEQHGSVSTSGHMRVLLPHESATVGSRMQTFRRDWVGFLSDPEFMATCKVVVAKDGLGLTTGQTSVNADRLLAMPDDIEDAVTPGTPGTDAWDGLPVVFKLGRTRVVCDGHHRLMRRLLVGQPIRYRFVTEADLIAWQRR